MRRIGKLGFAGLLAIGFAAQAHAGLFNIFGKKTDCGTSGCAPGCAAPVEPCYTPPKIYDPGCSPAGCAPAGCAPTGCATKPKATGLFSCFKKSSAPGCATGCADGCATEPGCAIPTPCKASGGSLLDCFSKKPCAPMNSCAPPVCRSEPIYPITCTPGECGTGCATTPCKASSGGGLFGLFKKKSSCAPAGCAPATCAPATCAPAACAPVTVTAPCATDGCAPACAAPVTMPCKSGGGLFGLFKKKSSCGSGCAPTTVCGPTACATAPVCVTAPGCAPQRGVSVESCGNGGCASTCGSAGCLTMTPSRLARTIYTAQAAPTPFQRKYAVEQLGKVDAAGNPEVMSALVYALNDSDQGVRQVAAEEIDRVVSRNQQYSGNSQVVNALNTALADPNQNVRQTAGRALQHCGYEVPGCKTSSCSTVSCGTTSCGAAGCAPKMTIQPSAPVHSAPVHNNPVYSEPAPQHVPAVQPQMIQPTPAVTPNAAPQQPMNAQPTPTPATELAPPAPPQAPAVESDAFFPSRIEQPQASQPRRSNERIAADLFGLPN